MPAHSVVIVTSYSVSQHSSVLTGFLWITNIYSRKFYNMILNLIKPCCLVAHEGPIKIIFTFIFAVPLMEDRDYALFGLHLLRSLPKLNIRTVLHTRKRILQLKFSLPLSSPFQVGTSLTDSETRC